MAGVDEQQATTSRSDPDVDPAGPDQSPTADATAPTEARVQRVSDQLWPHLAIALDDRGLASAALVRGLERLVRSSDLGRLDDDAAAERAHAGAWRWTTEARWPRRAPAFVGPATIPKTGRPGDGEPDPSTPAIIALGSLPPRQRSAVLGELAGWSDESSARAHATKPSTIALRRQRAWFELDKQLDDDSGDVNTRALVEAAAARLLVDVGPGAPEAADVQRRAGRSRLINRVAAAVATVLLIAVVGGAIRSLDSEPVVEEVTIERADPPRGSQAPFAPISDGRGGFIALDARAWQLSESSDGIDWYDRSHLNVNELDLRLFIERIYRSDGRFVALVESSTGGGRSLTGTDAQRVAIADSIDRWRLRRFEAPDLPTVPGLRAEVDLINAALAGDQLLVAIEIEHEIDLAGERIARRDVCTIANDDAGIVVHRCDGSAIVIVDGAERAEARLDDGHRLYRSVAGAAFVEVPVTPDFNPYALQAFDGGFAMLDESTSVLSTSADGLSWTPIFETGVDNRLGLLEAGPDRALAIAPSERGWASHLVEDGAVLTGRLPIDIEPTSIWLRPEVARGPAGWAVFVTTSRPWERGTRSSFGWALQSGDWVVERKADEATLIVRSTVDQAVYEYRNLVDSRGTPLPHPDVDQGMFGDVRIRRPGSAEVLVTVDGAQIRQSWITGEAVGDPPFGSVEWDGFTIRGNLRTGPLELVDADGRTRSWSDGFAFTDGSTTDGVETDRFTGTDDPSVDFHDDGLIVSVPLEVLEPLDLPPVARRDGELRAVVVWSADGLNWQVVWESRSDTWYGSVAVGDDELLVSTAGIVGEPVRVPLPAD